MANEAYEKESRGDKKNIAPQCCVGCAVWQQFGKKCWYYWEGKKHCTMWTPSVV